MKNSFAFAELFVIALVVTLLIPQPAMAYVGPGAGLLAIAAFIALSLAVLAALLGFLWFPLKRLLKKRNQPTTEEDQGLGEIQE